MGAECGFERAVNTMQAAIELNPEEHITLHVDFINAYNTLSRRTMLDSVFKDPKLSNLWKVFDFSYSGASLLLLRDRGHVEDVMLSDRGVKQGCVLASLGFSHALQPIYEAALDGQVNCVARAIIDDFVVSGPPMEVFAVFDALRAAAKAIGLEFNMTKTLIQQAAGEPSDYTQQQCKARALKIVLGNVKYLGVYLGTDDAAGTAFLSGKLSKQSPVAAAISDPRFPIQVASTLAKIHKLPTPIYYIRALPLRVTQAPVRDFDTTLSEALALRMTLPLPLPLPALVSYSQPKKNGGRGFRSMEAIAPAARWASLASSATDVQPFFDAALANGVTLPLMTDRQHAFTALAGAGVQLAVEDEAFEDDGDEHGPYTTPKRFYKLPHDPAAVVNYYDGMHRLRHLQQVLTLQIENAVLSDFVSSCSAQDLARVVSCKSDGAWRWLSPNPLVAPLSDFEMQTAVRLRDGLPPLDDLPSVCPLCRGGVVRDDVFWHCLSCTNLKRLSINVRHNEVVQLIINFARAHGCIAHEIKKDLDDLLPDGVIYFARKTVFFDVSGINLNAASYRDLAPGAAVDGREQHKLGKYQTYARTLCSSFVPFVLDCYGSLGPKGHQLLLDIVAEHLGLGLPPQPLSSFLSVVSVSWQKGNARILREWVTKSAAAHFRGIHKPQ